MPWGSDPAELDELVRELGQMGAQTCLSEVDLAEPDAAADMFDQIESALGEVTALVVVHTHDTGGGLLDVSAATSTVTWQ